MTYAEIIHAWICCVNDTADGDYWYWLDAYLNPADQYYHPNVNGWWGFDN